jgi:hypothetical protein
MDLALLETSPDLGGKWGGYQGTGGRVSLSPGRAEIDGHQVSWTPLEAQSLKRTFHIK